MKKCLVAAIAAFAPALLNVALLAALLMGRAAGVPAPRLFAAGVLAIVVTLGARLLTAGADVHAAASEAAATVSEVAECTEATHLIVLFALVGVADRRGHDYLTSEPFVLAGLELGSLIADSIHADAHDISRALEIASQRFGRAFGAVLIMPAIIASRRSDGQARGSLAPPRSPSATSRCGPSSAGGTP